jgi:hypothetical protein
MCPYLHNTVIHLEGCHPVVNPRNMEDLVMLCQLETRTKDDL